ncbi:uncharacterized protein I206_106117 [Kwoniella pini CBS 10737]|uniref:LYR motif-containing protein Cup1-like N-terminal domain-containing protein n=1 Tax=Kwoniella pini CBS 10737 TaxID=1296096 RepID=A0A1B9I140_9TREE|nr:uncharacterized protein I206_04941 [Kwoniella pini CBS 10737]OCF49253.1 hypothetical protein I206_04941 [Kwoniella pini CBS 10737]
MLLPSSFSQPAQAQSAKQLYRRYLQHIRLLPDPHIWSVLIPRFRQYLRKPYVGSIDPRDNDLLSTRKAHAESSLDAQRRVLRWKREKALKRAEKELQRLRAAVACHPHALTRLIEESYGQRGRLRQEVLRSISERCGVKAYEDPLPPLLQPLKPAPAPLSEAQPRARANMPPCRIRTGLRRTIQRDWSMIKPPIPFLLPVTMESRITLLNSGSSDALVENLARLCNLGDLSSSAPVDMATLDLSSLPPKIQRIFPLKSIPVLRESPLYPPRPKSTRQNPNIWSLPRRLDARLLRRTYQRFWNGLVWVRPVTLSQPEMQWKQCSFEEFRCWQTGKVTDQLSDHKGGQLRKNRRSVEHFARTNDASKWSVASKGEIESLATGS